MNAYRIAEIVAFLTKHRPGWTWRQAGKVVWIVSDADGLERFSLVMDHWYGVDWRAYSECDDRYGGSVHVMYHAESAVEAMRGVINATLGLGETAIDPPAGGMRE